MSEIDFTGNRSPTGIDPYYKNISDIMETVNGVSIELTPDKREKMENRINDLNEIIGSPDVWQDLVDKYARPNKINYDNVQRSLLSHNHVHPLRHIGNTYNLDNFKFIYYHKGELVREVTAGFGDVVYGLSSGEPHEGTIYIGNTYQVFLDIENLSTEDFLSLGRSVYQNREMFTIPAWEINIYGANGIVKEEHVLSAKENSLSKNGTNNYKYDMNNALLWCASKGIPSRNGGNPINMHLDVKTFPKTSCVFDYDNPNAKFNTDNELSIHCRNIIEHSKTMSETVGHAFRKLFTVIMVVTIKSKNPPLLNNIFVVMLTKMKEVAEASGAKILGMNVDSFELDKELDERFIGKEPGKFKKVN